MSLIAILILLFTGIVFGIWLSVSILRRIASQSHKSVISQEIFAKICHYRQANYHIHLSNGNIASVTITQNEETKDDVSLEDALKQLGYKKDEILTATKHISETMSNEPIGDKLKESLKYLGGKNDSKNI